MCKKMELEAKNVAISEIGKGFILFDSLVIKDDYPELVDDFIMVAGFSEEDAKKAAHNVSLFEKGF